MSEFSHAGLIDSMLRNWDLGVGEGQQAAFEHWRVERRSAAWEAIVHEVDRLGIDRRVFMGENIVFPVSVEGDRLRIRPTLVVDLRRSAIFIDQQVGATALLDTWSERVAEPLPTPAGANAGAADPFATPPEVIASELRLRPEETVRTLFAAWERELPASEQDLARRLAHGQRLAATRLGTELSEWLDSIDPDQARWKDVPDVVNSLLSIVEQPAATVETKLRAVLKFTTVIAAINAGSADAALSDPWKLLAPREAGDESVSSSPGGLWLNKHFDEKLSVEKLIALLLEQAKKTDATYVAKAIAQMKMPAEPSRIAAEYQVLHDEPVSILDLEVMTAGEIRTRLVQWSHVGTALQALDDNEPSMMDAVAGELALAATVDKSDELATTIKEYADRAASDAGGTIRPGALKRVEWAGSLQRFQSRLLSDATTKERGVATLRYSRLHEVLAARLSFENGAYADALRRQFRETVPLSLYHPAIVMQVLTGDFRGMPEQPHGREEGGRLIISAKHGANRSDVLSIGGIPAELLPSLGDAIANLDDNGWQEGERASDQLLAALIPAREPLIRMVRTVRGDIVWLTLLKAMVCGCGVPAQSIVPPSGRCAAIGETLARHDRVKGDAMVFHPAKPEDLDKVALLRFAPATR